jgi:hypothetical protein
VEARKQRSGLTESGRATRGLTQRDWGRAPKADDDRRSAGKSKLSPPPDCDSASLYRIFFSYFLSLSLPIYLPLPLSLSLPCQRLTELVNAAPRVAITWAGLCCCLTQPRLSRPSRSLSSLSSFRPASSPSTTTTTPHLSPVRPRYFIDVAVWSFYTVHSVRVVTTVVLDDGERQAPSRPPGAYVRSLRCDRAHPRFRTADALQTLQSPSRTLESSFSQSIAVSFRPELP